MAAPDPDPDPDSALAAGAAPGLVAPPPLAAPKLGRAHWRRLRDVYRSAGWPSRDAIEIDLLAAGLVAARAPSADAALETLMLTERGLAALAAAQGRNRAAFGAHEALVEQVAQAMLRDGRLVWRGLALRAPVDEGGADAKAAADALARNDGAGPAQPAGADDDYSLDGARSQRPPARRWRIGQPDVYSLRPSTHHAGLEPIVHEIKVSRADLLGDLKQPDKRAAYLAVSSQCWYVLAEGIADPGELPEECGVLVAQGTRLVCARPAPKRPFSPSLALWLALARASPLPSLAAEGDEAQGLL